MIGKRLLILGVPALVFVQSLIGSFSYCVPAAAPPIFAQAILMPAKVLMLRRQSAPPVGT